MPRVLVLTASFGEGHNQAGTAVSEALRRDGAEVKMIDYVDWLNPTFRSVATFTLLQGVQKMPSLYGLFYKSMSRMNPDSSLQKRLNQLGLTRMKQQIRSFTPDAVVSTFPVPTGIVSELREMGWTSIPNIGILTDYTTNGQWVKKHIDMYFVATEDIKRELMGRGVPGEKISAPGMPVRSKFVERSLSDLAGMRTELRAQHGLRTDVPLIMMMGGGAGLLGDISDWEKLMKQDGAQYVVICGRNERLYRKLVALETERVRILGYVTNIDEWMAMADLIVTKAGGITVSECMTMELPMLVYRPIPGQEDFNAQFAIHHGFAVKAKDFPAARRLIGDLTTHPERLEEMRANARRAKRPEAASEIARTVLDLIAAYRASHPADAAGRVTAAEAAPKRDRRTLAASGAGRVAGRASRRS
ncbi:MAG: glycosyltransferase [Alicyclobacillus sp.]|nr:glycosyltransferase [Alicyclobacillus sp.]